ncbi:hypothetical protein EYF80_035321 [Liparis tanakae]|uniref:Uncharacterized protein n=1 Tax=Liparis tanakae TaxID=230148 RepID=A0A4Z2GNU5_9TELE|nr:hypothetical protein EYF80_035321 [Liparis tanakae]
MELQQLKCLKVSVQSLLHSQWRPWKLRPSCTVMPDETGLFADVQTELLGFPPEEKKATRCGAFHSSSQNDGRKGKGEGNRVGGWICGSIVSEEISLCNTCNRGGDDDTISPQNDCQLGTPVIDVHPIEMGETLTDSSPGTS